jgi:histidinol-phosphate phosphatase family protein
MTSVDTSPDLRYEVVVPTIGRPSLLRLLGSLTSAAGPGPEAVWLVDDRPDPSSSLLDPGLVGALPFPVRILGSGGRGPAAARNAGWRAGAAPWVSFLDDDVVPGPGWRRDLVADLARLGPGEAASQGRIEVPLPVERRPTDWERQVASLSSARWATADMAIRRTALEVVGGFDERFPRAYREDTDLALRLMAAGFTLTTGDRVIEHPVGPAGRWVSVRRQAGNRDDAMMRALHGPSWRHHGGAPPGRLAWHVTTCAAAAVAATGALTRKPAVALAGASLWSLLTVGFAVERIRPGPRTVEETATMAATSALIPFSAVANRLVGEARARRVRRARARLTADPVAAVLFDRDGTLVHDVPYNADPDLVRPITGAGPALDRLRSRGIAVGVITNQSGIGRGLIELDAVAAVNARIDRELGPFATWQTCPHAPEDGCPCRKPAPGMVRAAAAELGVPVDRVVVVGDIGADVWAARAAGAAGVLVPTDRTRPVEVDLAAHVAADLEAAVTLIEAGAS